MLPRATPMIVAMVVQRKVRVGMIQPLCFSQMAVMASRAVWITDQISLTFSPMNVVTVFQTPDSPSPLPARSSTKPLNRSMIGEMRSEEHTSELQSLMRSSYAVFCLQKKKKQHQTH